MSEEIKNVISLSIVIFLYASVPIIFFMIIYVGFNIVVNIMQILNQPDSIDVFWITFLVIVEIILIYLLKKLIIWIRK